MALGNLTLYALGRLRNGGGLNVGPLAFSETTPPITRKALTLPLLLAPAAIVKREPRATESSTGDAEQDDAPADASFARKRCEAPHARHCFDICFAWIRLGSPVRNLRDIHSVLIDAAECLGGPSARLSEWVGLDNAKVLVPHRATTQKWTIKLCLVVMAWRRSCLGREPSVARHFGAGASPQAGYNLLCTREEVSDFGGQPPVTIGGNLFLGGFTWTTFTGFHIRPR